MNERFRQAIQIALALVIANAASLSLDWDNAKWAGIAIAVCALATGGEALQKGSQRIVGTLIGAAVGLTILAFFIQDRWLYLLVTTAWIGFCAWRHIANPNGYYWVLAAFIVPLLTVMSGAESQQAFETALLRVEQTCLGIIVFSLVATFVLPLSTRGAIERDVSEQTRALRRILGDTLTSLLGMDRTQDEVDSTPLGAVVAAASQRQKSLSPKLAAAALESFEVAEIRSTWRDMIRDLERLEAILGRLRTGLKDFSGAAHGDRLSGLKEYGDEIQRRLDVTAALLQGGTADAEARDVALELDETVALSSFDRAALVAAHRRLEEMDDLTRGLMSGAEEVRDLRRNARRPVSSEGGGASTSSWLPDPERVAGAIFVMTAFALFGLVYIYVPALPSPPLMLAMGTALAVTLASAPFLPLSTVTFAGLVAVAIGCAFHVLLMPGLEGFGALAIYLFLAAFGICVVWHKPEQGLHRTFACASSWRSPTSTTSRPTASRRASISASSSSLRSSSSRSRSGRRSRSRRRSSTGALSGGTSTRSPR